MIRILVLSAFLGFVFFLAERLGIVNWFHPDYPRMVVFFLALELICHFLIQRGLANNREQFVLFYLGATVLRLLAGLAFVFVFFRLGTPLFQRFILNFFVLYLFYAGFELYAVRRKLRHFSE